MPAIEVSHLTKEYRLGAMQGLKQSLLNTGARIMGKKVPERPLFKALDDVNFSVEQGEVVGIIGHNGAGKSTLLKMLARISTPTSGSVKVNGRIAPLIEVGAGFVPDFTGRENVYLNGSILGMSRKQIDRKLEEIVDFAEMAEFIDTPVKRYSSGMQVKLAFAVATSIESEILIVDEVLAVGDLAFQRKCFDRMERMIKRQGKTVLIVSHNIRQIERICERVILMDHGKLLEDDVAKVVCDHFYAQNDKRIQANIDAAHRTLSKASAKPPLVEVCETAVLGTDHVPVDSIVSGTDLFVRIVLHTTTSLINPVFAVGIHTTDFLYLGTQRSAGHISVDTLEPGRHTLECRLANLPLLPGTYSIRASIVAGSIPVDVFYGENLAHFRVISANDYCNSSMRGEGFISLNATWTLESPNTPSLPSQTEDCITPNLFNHLVESEQKNG